MTREEVEKEYRVVAGVIVSRGKFEGEPVYVPAFWQLALEGGFDDVETVGEGEFAEVHTFAFKIDASDVERWPELAGVRTLRLWEDDNGFVHHGVEKVEVPA